MVICKNSGVYVYFRDILNYIVGITMFLYSNFIDNKIRYRFSRVYRCHELLRNYMSFKAHSLAEIIIHLVLQIQFL